MGDAKMTVTALLVSITASVNLNSPSKIVLNIDLPNVWGDKFDHRIAASVELTIDEARKLSGNINNAAEWAALGDQDSETRLKRLGMPQVGKVN